MEIDVFDLACVFTGITVEILIATLFIIKTIIMKQSEVAADLLALKAQLGKVATEVNGKLAALETAINNLGEADPAVVAALGELKTATQGLDDLIPDESTTPAEPPVEG